MLNETWSSTVRPPKRNDRRSTSTSAIPSPPPAILLDLPIAATFPALAAEIEFLNVGVRAQPLCRAVEDDMSVLHDITVVGNLQRDGGALLYDQDREAELAADFAQPPQQFAYHHRGQSERKLIDQQQFRRTHDGAGQGQHLALAAGEEPTDALPEISQLGKELVDQCLAPALLGGGNPVRNGRDQVF